MRKILLRWNGLGLMMGVFGLAVVLAVAPAVVRADADQDFAAQCAFAGGNWSQNPYNGRNVCTCHGNPGTNTAFNPYTQFCFSGWVFNNHVGGSGGGGGGGGSGSGGAECGMGFSDLECEIWLARNA